MKRSPDATRKEPESGTKIRQPHVATRGEERFRILAEAAEQLLTARDPTTAVRGICTRVMEYLDCHAFFNFVADEETQRLSLNAYAGVSEKEAEKLAWLDYGVAVCGNAALLRQRIVVNNVCSVPDDRVELVRSYGIRAYACHPMFGRDGRLLGTLSFGTKSRDVYSEDDLSLMKAVTSLVAQAVIRGIDEESLRASEQHLREKGEQLRLFIEHAPAALAMFDRDMRYLAASQRWLMDFNLGGRDLTGRSHYEVFPDIPDRWKTVHRRGLSGKVVRADSDRFERADGSAQWLRWEVRPWHDHRGNVQGIVIFSEDITERKEAEAALRQREERFRALALAGNDVVYRMSPDWSTMVQLAGGAFIPDTETSSTSWLEKYIHPDDRAHVMATINEAVRAKSVFELEHRVIKADGDLGWTFSRAVPLLDNRGEITEWFGAARDITDRKTAERAVQESDNRHRALFENLPDAYCYCEMIFDGEGRPVDYVYLETNSAFVAMTGLGDVAGRKASEVFPGIREAHPEMLDTLGVVAVTGKPTKYEIHFTPLGKWFAVTAYSIKEGCISAIFHDITERKGSEETLRSQANLINLSYEAMFVFEPDGPIVSWNLGAQRLYGFTAEEAVGQRSDDLLKTAFPLGRDKTLALLLEEGVFAGEVTHTTKDGRTVTVDCRMQLIPRAPGRQVALQINRDVTDLRQLNIQLRQAHKMEIMGTLASGIAHDFNNILAAIIGFTELAIEDASLERPVLRHLKLVLKSGLRGRDLVKHILAYSRNEAPEGVPLALTPLVQETAKLLRASLPSTIDVKLRGRPASDIVMASPTQIQQVIMNLCTNASQAMKDETGEIRIILDEQEVGPNSPASMALSPGRYMELVVKDTGVGMDHETLERIFEPFFTTKEVGTGTGLGLWVVYGIVKELKGHVTVESEPGKGSTFRILLPSAEKVILREPGPRRALQGKERILFVDDEELLVLWGKNVLERHGYTVTVATSAAEAMRLFSPDPTLFDLVITDMTMPKTNGLAMAGIMVKRRPDIPIILCTGNLQISNERAAHAGIRSVLRKPLILQELIPAIRRVLDGEQGAD